MNVNLQKPDITELKPRIVIFGVGGGGGNAVSNMIESGLSGVEFVAANTDAQALQAIKCERLVQMGLIATQGLGAGSQPDVGRESAEECIDEIKDHLSGTHMAFVTAGMGGGTGTGAAPVVAKAAKEAGILTVGVVTKPFAFEGKRRMEIAEAGIIELQQYVDTLLVIPNQNLFRIANENTTFAEAFSMADQVLYSGVACITDLMVKKGLINLDFADVRSVMRDMGRAIMGTGEDSGDNRALKAAEAAISNPLLDETSMKGAQGLLISVTGGPDLTLSEVDEATSRVEKEVDSGAVIHFGATLDESFEGKIRVSVVATGVIATGEDSLPSHQSRFSEAAEKLRKSVAERSASSDSITAPASTALASKPLDVATPTVSSTLSPTPTVSATPTPTPTPTVSPTPVETPSTESMPLTTDDFSKALSEDLDSSLPLDEGIPSLSEIDGDDITPEAENGPIGLLKRLATGLSATEEGEQDSQQDSQSAIDTPPSASRPISTPEPLRLTPTPSPTPTPEPEPTHQSVSEELPQEDISSAPASSSPASTTPASASGVDIVSPTEGEDDQLDIPAFLRRQAR